MTAGLVLPDVQPALLARYVADLERLHPRLCPRQILGLRIGLHAGALLRLDLPRADKRVLVFVETDGCFADGVSVATGCWLGRRTLRLMDYGKVAATVVDTLSGRAYRLWPHAAARAGAGDYAPGAADRWHAQLIGYQIMPIEQLLRVEPVDVQLEIARIVGSPGRVTCSACGEEILNDREVLSPYGVRCLGCAGEPYYRAT
jgi:formylmethanofuran dehydrogenase subunit E